MGVYGVETANEVPEHGFYGVETAIEDSERVFTA
jgi:hypothetical protein